MHRKSNCYLLTIEKNEAEVVQEKMMSGDILGLDGIVYCFSEEIDELIEKLKRKTFAESEKVEVIKGDLVKEVEI